ncbi:MAG: hypothetical protein ACJ73C_19025 [Nitrososphaeraceae archaeon]
MDRRKGTKGKESIATRKNMTAYLWNCTSQTAQIISSIAVARK